LRIEPESYIRESEVAILEHEKLGGVLSVTSIGALSVTKGAGLLVSIVIRHLALYKKQRVSELPQR
jgi:hypothetical protein